MMRATSYYSTKLPWMLAVAISAATAPLHREPAWAQYPNPNPATQPDAPSPGISLERPRFSADATIQPGDQGQPEVRIDYRLARSELLFERTPAGFHAAYEIRVIFTAEKRNKQVAGDAYTRELKVGHYADTRSQGDDIVDHVTFHVAAGKYAIKVLITDLTAERTSSTTLPLDVPGVTTGQIWLTDLSLGALAADSAGVIVPQAGMDPNPSRRYGENLPRFAASGEVVDNRSKGEPDSVYMMKYWVMSDIQVEAAHGDTSFARRGGRTPFRIHPRLEVLEAGSYRIVVELSSPLSPTKGKKKAIPIRREKAFSVEQTAANTAIDPKSAIELIRYIATEPENKQMDLLSTAEERQAYWEAFWRGRDPTPDTPVNEAKEEFYKLVRYADQHFGVAGTSGWRSDMGRTYIQNGQPDEIVRNPFRFDGPPEEIWYYYKARKAYYFVDRDGFGRYVLDDTKRNG